MDHLNFLSWCSPEKKRNTVRENVQIFSLFLLSCDRSFPRLWKGKTSMYYFSRRFLPQGTTSAAKVYACAESILWVLTTAKRPMKSAYSYRIKHYQPMCREIYRPMSRPIYRPIYRWSIGEASVKYPWSIGERQLYRPIGVSVDISGDTQLIYRPILDRHSTV